LRISKDLDPAGADGENVGIVRLSRAGAQRFFEVADQAARRHEWNYWVPFGVDRIASSHPFFAVPTNDRPWIEIDYVHDLKAAREMVFPKIQRALTLKIA
jgi:choline kinase